jgi:hypothetical protein
MELYFTPKVNTLQLNTASYSSNTRSNPNGLGTLIPTEFFLQDLLWQSSNTHSQSCSQKASNHTSGQYIVGQSVHLHTTRAPRHIHHYPAIYQTRRSDVFTRTILKPNCLVHTKTLLYHYAISIVTSPFTMLLLWKCNKLIVTQQQCYVTMEMHTCNMSTCGNMYIM